MNVSANNGRTGRAAPIPTNPTITARKRRTPEQVHTDLLASEREKAAKNREKAQRLAAEAAAAEAEAEKAETRIQKIESAAPVAQMSQKGIDADEAVKGFGLDIKQFFDHMTEKYGFRIEYQEPKITKRGFVSGKFKADLMPTMVPLGVRPPTVTAREAGRFMQNYKELDLQPNLLGREIDLVGHESKYVVAGIRGKGNDIVLQKAGTSESYTMTHEDFKRSLSAP